MKNHVNIILRFLNYIIIVLFLSSYVDLAHGQDRGPGSIDLGTEPYAALSHSGKIYVVYAKEDSIYVTSASQIGEPFAHPQKVANVNGLVTKLRRGPRVAVVGDTVLVAAGSKVGENIRLSVWRSQEEGRTWSGPVKITGPQASSGEGMFDLTANAAGEEIFHAVWLDNRRGYGKVDILTASSFDHGQTWQEHQAYHSPSGTVCQCCPPSIKATADGAITIIFRNYLNGNRDMYSASSLDQGKTWGKAKKLGLGSWPLEICPVAGGGMAIKPDGTPVTIWSRQNEIFFSPLSGKETSLGFGMMPGIAVGSEGIYAIWRRRGEIVVKHKGEIHVLADDGHDPVIIGNAQGVLALWESEGRIQYQKLE